MKRVLIVEDDPDLLLGLKDNLEAEGFDVLTATDGEAGLQGAIRARPDAIVLDISLPRLNGFELCRSLRERGLRTPILMLTARSQESDKILGLELGADDYVTKPFSINELARVRVMIRRASAPPPASDVYRFGDVELDFRRQRARKGAADVLMSALEFSVIRYLVIRRGDAVSREQLLNDVWGSKSFPTTRSVDNLIVRLRQKLGSRDRLQVRRLIGNPALGGSLNVTFTSFPHIDLCDRPPQPGWVSAPAARPT
jgi:DNA-binding response OmpR family regulator